MERAVLESATLRNANLTGANLTEVRATWADFAGANLTGVRALGARCVDATFGDAVLDGADFTGAHLTRAELFSARRVGTRFFCADLRAVDLEDANLLDTCFDEADMQAARFSSVKGWESVCPVRSRSADFTGALLVQAHARSQSWWWEWSQRSVVHRLTVRQKAKGGGRQFVPTQHADAAGGRARPNLGRHRQELPHHGLHLAEPSRVAVGDRLVERQRTVPLGVASEERSDTVP